MYYVYALKNPKNEAIYIGFSADLRQRFRQQQANEHRGWELAYYEAYRDESEARLRERKLKQYGAALGHLKARIRKSLGSQALERAG